MSATHEMTCKKHGPVTGRLFASGDVLCPKCIEEATKDMVDNLTPEQRAVFDRTYGTSVGTTVPPKKEW